MFLYVQVALNNYMERGMIRSDYELQNLMLYNKPMSMVRFLEKWFFQVSFLLLLLLAPQALVWAHEVYVLTPDEVEHALTTSRPDFLATIQNNLGQFIVSGIVALVLVVVVFVIAETSFVEIFFNSFLHKLKLYTPFIMQFTFGVSLIAGGFYNATFGPELPLDASFGSFSDIFRFIFIVLGICILLGIYPRIASTIALIIFLPLLAQHGTYMLNYGTYYGEALAVALFGGGYALFTVKTPSFEKNIEHHLYKYKFLLLRIVFGLSLMYASLYAKFIHGGLALATVTTYHLTSYFPFEADFIVLGAFITELLIGFFILIGFEIRFASLMLLFFLVLSIGFFGEAVWPHIILFGTALAMFTHGYDRYTVVAKLSHRKDLEPVL